MLRLLLTITPLASPVFLQLAVLRHKEQLVHEALDRCSQAVEDTMLSVLVVAAARLSISAVLCICLE